MSNLLGRIATEYGIFQRPPHLYQYFDGSIAEFFEGSSMKVLFGEPIQGLQRPNINRPLPRAIALKTTSGGLHFIGEHGYLYIRDGQYTSFELSPIRSMQILIGSPFEIPGIVRTSPVDSILAHVEQNQTIPLQHVEVLNTTNPLSSYFDYFLGMNPDKEDCVGVMQDEPRIIWVNR